MSGASTPGAKPAKTMSSRLLTMKFMQRAAATAAAQSPSVEDPDTPSPKRPRLSANNSPATPPQPSSDLQAISAALAAEEQKRAEAVARQAAEAGETEWVIEFPGAEGSSYSAPAGYYEAGSVLSAYPGQPVILTAGSLDAEDGDMIHGGRRSYGNFKRKKQKQQANEDATSTSGSEDEDEEDDISESEQLDSMIRKAKSKADKKKPKKKKNNKKAEEKPISLSRLTSISGGRAGGGGGGGHLQRQGSKRGQKRTR